MAIWIFHDVDALIAFIINKNVFPIGSIYAYFDTDCVLSGPILKKKYDGATISFFRR